MKQPAVYILANQKNGTLYTGVTSNLCVRSYQHKTGTGAEFAKRHGCNKLVYYELHDTMLGAIEQEKRIKAGSRKKKMMMIQSMNPEWKDLYDDLA